MTSHKLYAYLFSGYLSLGVHVPPQASLEKAKTWIRELQRQADPSIIIALCGNKTDLEARRQVTKEEAQKYAEEEGLMWSETSAKSGEGVADIFISIGPWNYR
jgi:Ras-related protein Rab-5C